MFLFRLGITNKSEFDRLYFGDSLTFVLTLTVRNMANPVGDMAAIRCRVNDLLASHTTWLHY